MTNYIPNKWNRKRPTAAQNFAGEIVKIYPSAKALSRATDNRVSLPMAEKWRQGVVPQKTLEQFEAIVRDQGIGWLLASFADAIADYADKKEREAHEARKAFEHLRKSNQSRALDACDRTLWDRIED